MATITTRPNATPNNAGAAIIGGAATTYESVSDDSDVTGVEIDDGESIRFGFAEPSPPAGAVVKRLVIRARHKRAGATYPYIQYRAYPRFTTEQTATEAATIKLPTSIGTATVLVYENPGAITDLQVRCMENTPSHGGGGGSAGDARIYELYVDTVYVPTPTVVVDAPTGTLTEETNPTIEWTPDLDADGGEQTHYEVKVFTDDVVTGGGFDPDSSTAEYLSGEVASSDASHALSDPLPDDDYHAYVRVAQTVNGEQLWSEWDDQAFTIDVPAPDPPSIAVEAQPDDARIGMAVTPDDDPVTTDAVEIQARYDDGEFGPIRTPDGDSRVVERDDDGDYLAWDWDAPNGVEARYRARSIHTYASGDAYSDWVESDPVTWSSDIVWLKHPVTPELNMAVHVQSYPGRTRAVSQSKVKILGRRFPIIVSQVGDSDEGAIAFDVEEADFDAMQELVDAAVPLHLQHPADHKARDRWIMLGDLSASRYGLDRAWIPEGLWAFSWVEVDRPTDEELVALDLYPAESLYPDDEEFPGA